MKQLNPNHVESVAGGLHEPEHFDQELLPEIASAEPVIDHNPTPQPQ